MAYNIDDIKVIRWYETVRKNPTMYRISPGLEGCVELLNEVVDSIFAPKYGCHASRLEIRLTQHQMIIFEYNGSGMPIESLDVEGIVEPSLYRTMMGRCIAGNLDKFDCNEYGHLLEIGPFLNAVCDELMITTFKDGSSYASSFRKGLLSTPLHKKPTVRTNMLKMAFDSEVMGNVAISISDLKKLATTHRKKYPEAEIICS